MQLSCLNCGKRLIVNLVSARGKGKKPDGQGYCRCPSCGHYMPVVFERQ